MEVGKPMDGAEVPTPSFRWALGKLQELEPASEAWLTRFRVAQIRRDEAGIWPVIARVAVEELEGAFERGWVGTYLARVCTLALWAKKVKEKNLELKKGLVEEFKKLILESPPWKIRLLPQRFVMACRNVALLVHRKRDGFLASTLVLVMKMAAEKLEPSALHLVPVHVDFLMMCILAKVYWVARPLLVNRRLKVDVPETSISAIDVLLTFYYSGIVALVLKEYRLALQSFRLVLLVPSQVVSNVAVAAYEKFILVSLIVDGCLPSERSTTLNISPQLRSTVTIYTDLAKVYSKKNVTELKKTIAMHSMKFKADGNKGLINQVELACLKQHVARLSDSYVRVGFDRLSAKLGLPDGQQVESLLLRMVDEGSHDASLDGKQKLVSFSEHARKDLFGTRIGPDDQLEAQVNSCLVAIERIQDFREQLAHDRSLPLDSTKNMLSESGSAGIGSLDSEPMF